MIGTGCRGGMPALILPDWVCESHRISWLGCRVPGLTCKWYCSVGMGRPRTADGLDQRPVLPNWRIMAP